MDRMPGSPWGLPGRMNRKDALMGNALVFGSLNMDLSIACGRMPQQGETLAGSGFCTNPGGKGANQAVAAAKAGAATSMIGSVGNDAFGHELIEGLAGYGVECSGVTVAPGVPTGVAVIIRTEGDNRIILDHGANGRSCAAEVASEIRQRGAAGDIFLTQMECDLETTACALHAAHEAGMRTLLNAAPPEKLPDAAWADVDIICVNETECAALVGILPTSRESAREALSALCALGPEVAIVTLGAEGSSGLSEGRFISVAADRIEAVDTTASGDTYIGYLAAGYVSGMGLEEAMQRATHAAGLTATRIGAQQAIPVASEVDRCSQKEQAQG